MANKNKQKKGIGAFWVGLICFVLVAAVLAGLTGWRTSGFKDWTYGFGSPRAPLPDDTDNPDDENKDPSGADKLSGITLASKRIAREDFAAYGVSEDAESANELSVQLSPENGKFDTIQWSIAWEDPNSEWVMTGSAGMPVGSVDGFLTIDNTHYTETGMTDESGRYAVLSLMQRFGETIILTCTVTANGVDYVKTCRIECPSVPESILGYDPSSGPNFSITMENIKTEKLTMDYVWGVGTLKPDSVSGDLRVELNSTMVSLLMDTGMGYNYTFANNGVITYSGNQLLADDFTFGLDLSKLLVGEYDETEFWNDFHELTVNSPFTDTPIMTISVDLLEFSLKGEFLCSLTAYAQIFQTDFSNLATWVTDFELSKDVIILF